jgi:hypothetical protein
MYSHQSSSSSEMSSSNSSSPKRSGAGRPAKYQLQGNEKADAKILQRRKKNLESQKASQDRKKLEQELQQSDIATLRQYILDNNLQLPALKSKLSRKLEEDASAQPIAKKRNASLAPAADPTLAPAPGLAPPPTPLTFPDPLMNNAWAPDQDFNFDQHLLMPSSGVLSAEDAFLSQFEGFQDPNPLKGYYPVISNDLSYATALQNAPPQADFLSLELPNQFDTGFSPYL